jgi:hypothetical protein
MNIPDMGEDAKEILEEMASANEEYLTARLRIAYEEGFRDGIKCWQCSNNVVCTHDN